MVHADQVLQHVTDPVRALREMRRVCRPGGIVAARDSDYAAFTVVTATASTWCFATPEDRQRWGGMWADRIRHSAMADQVRASGLATEEDLARLSTGWREWAAADDCWFTILHGEILCRA